MLFKYWWIDMNKNKKPTRNKFNPVAKNARKFNKFMVHSDKYKELRSGHIKHKGRHFDKDV